MKQELQMLWIRNNLHLKNDKSNKILFKFSLTLKEMKCLQVVLAIDLFCLALVVYALFAKSCSAHSPLPHENKLFVWMRLSRSCVPWCLFCYIQQFLGKKTTALIYTTSTFYNITLLQYLYFSFSQAGEDPRGFRPRHSSPPQTKYHLRH